MNEVNIKKKSKKLSLKRILVISIIFVSVLIILSLGWAMTQTKLFSPLLSPSPLPSVVEAAGTDITTFSVTAKDVSTSLSDSGITGITIKEINVNGIPINKTDFSSQDFNLTTSFDRSGLKYKSKNDGVSQTIQITNNKATRQSFSGNVLGTIDYSSITWNGTVYDLTKFSISSPLILRGFNQTDPDGKKTDRIVAPNIFMDDVYKKRINFQEEAQTGGYVILYQDKGISYFNLTWATKQIDPLSSAKVDPTYYNQTDGFTLEGVASYGIVANSTNILVLTDQRKIRLYNFSGNYTTLFTYINSISQYCPLATNWSDYWLQDGSGKNFIFHLNSTGGNVTNGFGIDSNPKGIFSNISDLWWMVKPSSSYINHTDLLGNKISDSILLPSGIDAPFGLYRNESDFFVNDYIDKFIYHLNSSGSNLSDGIDYSLIGASNTRGLASNSTDGTPIDYWINDVTDKFIYHLGLTDVSPPNVIFMSPPINNTNSSNINLNINYTISDESSLSNCWYSNDTFAVNVSLENCSTNITFLTWESGLHTIRIYANDSNSNIGFSSRTFRIDLIKPDISITYPSMNLSTTETGLDINYTTSDDIAIGNCWYSNDSMSKNITLANCGTNITTVVWTVGWHNVTVWVNDSAGNINSSFVNFTIASIPPNISIVYPSNITFSYNTNLNINYTISDDVGISSCWYSNDTFSVNTSLGTTCDNITTLTWNEGVHNVKVYVNDTNSNVVYSSIMFIISNSTKTLNVYLNLTGNVYGWNLLWKKNYSGSWDEFGGVVIENNWSNIYGYTVSKTTSGNITKFDAITGDLIWTTHIGTSDGTPLLDGNNIYINTLQQNSSAKPLADDNNNSGIYKINKTDGTILSENHTCNSLSGGATYANGSSQSITMNDNLIFEGCQNGIIYAYNKNDLTLNWSYVPYIDSSMSILMSPIYQHDRITFGFYNNSGADSPIIQINSTNGSWIWNSSIIGSIWDSQPSSYNDKIYIGFYDGSGEYSLNETNGTTIFNVASLIPNGGYILTQSTIYNDEVLYGEYSVFFHYSNLIIRNASTGIDICSYPNYLDNKHLNGKIVQGPSVAGGIAYFGSVENTTNTVYGINASDCSLIGRLQTNGAVYNPPAIAYGNIYYKDDQYNLYAYNLGDGYGDWAYLGYDSTGQSNSPTGVTNLKGVETTCINISSSQYNCSSINKYDATMNATLISPIVTQWRNISGDLVQDWNTTYTFSINANENINLTLGADTTPPYFLELPTNQTLNNKTQLNYKINASDNAGLYCFYVNDATNFSINCSGSLKNNTVLAVGYYELNISINDTSDNWNSTIMSVNITLGDTEYPLFSSYWSNNNSQYKNGVGVFNVTLLSTNGTVWLTWYNGTNYTASNNSGDGTVFNVSIPLTANGTFSYNWTSYGNGSSNLLNKSNEQYYTVLDDVTPPSLNITYPIYNSVYSSLTLDLNYSWSDVVGVSACWYSNSSGAVNYSLAGCGNLTAVTWKEGVNNVTVWVNDTSGNENSSFVTFNVTDNVYPLFSSYWDNNGTVQGTTVRINVTLSNSNGTVILTFDGTNYTASATGNRYNVSITGVTTGTYPYNWSSYGTGFKSNYNVSEARVFTVEAADTTPPTFTNLANKTKVVNSDLYYDINANDVSGLGTWEVNNTVSYKIDGTTGVLENNTGITSAVIHYINISVNDTFGNLASAVIWINWTAAAGGTVVATHHFGYEPVIQFVYGRGFGYK